MKKLFLSIVSLFILVVFTANTFALSAKSSAAIGSISGVRYLAEDVRETVAVDINQYTSYKVIRISQPDRIVLDITGASAPGKQQMVEAGGKLIKSIRYAQFDVNVSRVVLEVSGNPEYRVDKTDRGLTLVVGDISIGNIPDNPGTGTGDNAGNTDNTAKDGTGEKTESPSVKQPLGRADKQKLSLDKNFNVEYASDGSKEEIAIVTGSYKDYNVMRLTGPDRIVIDIPNIVTSVKEKKLEVNNIFLQSIRFAQYGKNTARVVLDTKNQAYFKVEEKAGRLVVSIENPGYKNITYYNNGDRIYFNLSKARLTEGAEGLTKLYTEKYDASGKKYTITFPGNLADLGSGTMRINDGLLDSVEISKNSETGETSITFNAKSKLAYVAFRRYERNCGVDDTNITVLKPAAKTNRLVVIDAGHGGGDPGAVVGNLKEKELNLDIAKRLDSLLEKKKIRTYMMREDDSYVGLYERAYIANALNASLFLSVHNNSIADPAFGGTMTLYYPQRADSVGFNAKVFARMIQDKLLGTLKTTDRKIIERPNLVVLKGTTMPSAIAEVAFMTNQKDRTNLQDPAFRQKAAQALCDAVVQALGQLK